MTQQLCAAHRATVKRALRVYLDSNILGLDVREVRKALIKWTGEKPGKDWLKRVRKHLAKEA